MTPFMESLFSVGVVSVVYCWKMFFHLAGGLEVSSQDILSIKHLIFCSLEYLKSNSLYFTHQFMLKKIWTMHVNILNLWISEIFCIDFNLHSTNTST